MATSLLVGDVETCGWTYTISRHTMQVKSPHPPPPLQALAALLSASQAWPALARSGFSSTLSWCAQCASPPLRCAVVQWRPSRSAGPAHAVLHPALLPPPYGT